MIPTFKGNIRINTKVLYTISVRITFVVAPPDGLEPSTFGSEPKILTIKLKRCMAAQVGTDPTPTVSKTAILPLYDWAIIKTLKKTVLQTVA